MPSTKRALGDEENSSSLSKKSKKLNINRGRRTVPEERISNKDARIEELGKLVTSKDAQLHHYREFFIEKHLSSFEEMPETIRQHIEASPGAADIFDTVIRNKIAFLYDSSKDALPEELCKEMAKLTPIIKRISSMEPSGLEKAFHLILVLGKHTYRPHEINKTYTYLREGEDEEIDTLLLEFARKCKEKNPAFVTELAYFQLGEQRKQLNEVPHFHAYFRTSFYLMQEWDLKIAERLYDDIKDQILEAYKTAISELRYQSPQQIQSAPQQLLSVCPISQAIRVFIPKIRSLSNRSWGGRRLAFQLVFFVGSHSFLERCPFGNKAPARQSDEELDDLLVEISKGIKGDNRIFKPVEEFKNLKAEINFLAERGVSSYFPSSYNLLAKWLPDVARDFAKEQYDEVKFRVDKAYHSVERILESFKKSGKRPTTDMFWEKMSPFTTETRNLAKVAQGLPFALKLTFEIGQYSISVLNILGSGILNLDHTILDELMSELIELARNDKKSNGPQLKESILHVLGYQDFRSYFPRSHALMTCNQRQSLSKGAGD